MECLQAIYTSAQTAQGTGYQIVAYSKGDNKLSFSEKCLESIANNSTLGGVYPPSSPFIKVTRLFKLPSDKSCFLRIFDGGKDQAGRPRTCYAHSMTFNSEQMKFLGYNPYILEALSPFILDHSYMNVVPETKQGKCLDMKKVASFAKIEFIPEEDRFKFRCSACKAFSESLAKDEQGIIRCPKCQEQLVDVSELSLSFLKKQAEHGRWDLAVQIVEEILHSRQIDGQKPIVVFLQSSEDEKELIYLVFLMLPAFIRKDLSFSTVCLTTYKSDFSLNLVLTGVTNILPFYFDSRKFAVLTEERRHPSDNGGFLLESKNDCNFLLEVIEAIDGLKSSPRGERFVSQARGSLLREKALLLLNEWEEKKKKLEARKDVDSQSDPFELFKSYLKIFEGLMEDYKNKGGVFRWIPPGICRGEVSRLLKKKHLLEKLADSSIAASRDERVGEEVVEDMRRVIDMLSRNGRHSEVDFVIRMLKVRLVDSDHVWDNFTKDFGASLWKSEKAPENSVR